MLVVDLSTTSHGSIHLRTVGTALEIVEGEKFYYVLGSFEPLIWLASRVTFTQHVLETPIQLVHNQGITLNVLISFS